MASDNRGVSKSYLTGILAVNRWHWKRNPSRFDRESDLGNTRTRSMIQALTGALMGSPKHSSSSGNAASPASNNINMMPRGKGKVTNRSSTRSSDLPEDLKNMNKLMNEIKVKDSLVCALSVYHTAVLSDLTLIQYTNHERSPDDFLLRSYFLSMTSIYFELDCLTFAMI